MSTLSPLPQMRVIVPATWKELHLRALTFTAPDDWLWLLNNFIPRIDCSNCSANFIAWRRSHPPLFGKKEWDYFGWTVAAHNAVNAHLGKPQLTLEQARAAWQVPAG